jgi:hypothetical protein
MKLNRRIGPYLASTSLHSYSNLHSRYVLFISLINSSLSMYISPEDRIDWDHVFAQGPLMMEIRFFTNHESMGQPKVVFCFVLICLTPSLFHSP